LIDVSLTLSPIKDRDGRIIGISSISRDITVQKKVRNEMAQNERLMSAIIKSVPAGIILVDERGKILISNPYLDNMFGYGENGVVGLTVEDLIPKQVRAKHPALRQKFLANPQMRQMGAGRELMGQRRDGSEVPVEVGLAPVADQGRMRVLATLIDITERKKA